MDTHAHFSRSRAWKFNDVFGLVIQLLEKSPKFGLTYGLGVNIIYIYIIMCVCVCVCVCDILKLSVTYTWHAAWM